MPVVVLETFAHQGGPSSRAAGQDAASTDVAERPGQVAHSLESEHGIEEEDRDHGLAPGGVGRGQRDERGQRARFADALLEHLARRALCVVQREVGVDRDVVLSVGRVDLGLGDDRLQPEGAGLVRDDRGDERTDLGVAHEVAQHPGEHHGGRHRLGTRAVGELGEHLGVGPARRALAHDPDGERSLQHPSTGAQVLHGFGALGRADVGRVSLERVVGDVVSHVEPVAQRRAAAPWSSS